MNFRYIELKNGSRWKFSTDKHKKMEFSVDKAQNPIYTVHPLWPYPPANAAIRKKRQGGHRQQRCAPAGQIFSRDFAHAHNKTIVGLNKSLKQQCISICAFRREGKKKR
jgi:hypothetical protein